MVQTVCGWERECADALCSSTPVSICNATSIEKVELMLYDNHRQSLRDIADFKSRIPDFTLYCKISTSVNYKREICKKKPDVMEFFNIFPGFSV